MHILLITRHYPPEISGGARRPSLYVKALRLLGHKVTVVVPFQIEDSDCIVVENAAINRGQNQTSENTLHVSIYKRWFNRLKAWLRQWMYWPDPDISWVEEVIKTVKKKNIKADWIMTTSPSESVHIAGKKLTKYMGVPWLAEFRDTWIESPHRQILEVSKLRVSLERLMAKRTLRHVSAVTSVSETVMREARQYISQGVSELVIPHFSDPAPDPHNFNPSKLNVLHAGGFTLSDRRRLLLPLIEVLIRVSKHVPNLVFHIIGALSEKEIEMINSVDLEIKWHGPVSLLSSRAMQAGADGLILYSPPNSHALPGKYSEYVFTGKPILYFGNGPWINLIDDRNNIKSLEEGLLVLQKNEIYIPNGILTHIAAAKQLVEFLKRANNI